MPETLGIGVDLCAVSRMARAAEKEHFRNRVFTESERAYLQSRGKGAGQSAAAMFAAKEAVAKALGTGFAGFGFADIEILPEENGRPTARLTGGALNALPQSARIHVSISHDGGLALAFAVIESA